MYLVRAGKFLFGPAETSVWPVKIIQTGLVTTNTKFSTSNYSESSKKA